MATTVKHHQKPLFHFACLPSSHYVLKLGRINIENCKNKQTNKLVSVFCVCPLIDDKFCHNIVKAYYGTTCLQFVVPHRSTLTMLWCNLSSIRGHTCKKWCQFVNLSPWPIKKDTANPTNPSKGDRNTSWVAVIGSAGKHVQVSHICFGLYLCLTKKLCPLSVFKEIQACYFTQPFTFWHSSENSCTSSIE